VLLVAGLLGSLPNTAGRVTLVGSFALLLANNNRIAGSGFAITRADFKSHGFDR